jgi:hypothetical protein
LVHAAVPVIDFSIHDVPEPYHTKVAAAATVKDEPSLASSVPAS